MAGWLSTHVLDAARGCPAAGMTIELYRLDGDTRTYLHSRVTNADGRTDAPILPETEFRPGTYELVFHTGDYFVKLLNHVFHGTQQLSGFASTAEDGESLPSPQRSETQE